MSDLKAICTAADEPSALDALNTFSEHLDKKSSWRDNRHDLRTYFKYPQEVRRLIYTTNTIEGVNRQLRKVTKSGPIFPADDSLFKMLYPAMMDITKKMDRTTAGLEYAPCPAGDLLCRPNARVTPPWLDVKGGIMLQEERHRAGRWRLLLFRSVFAPTFAGYIKFGIDPKTAEEAQRSCQSFFAHYFRVPTATGYSQIL